MIESPREFRRWSKPYRRVDFWTWRAGVTIRVYRMGLYLGLPLGKQNSGWAFNRHHVGLRVVGWFRW